MSFRVLQITELKSGPILDGYKVDLVKMLSDGGMSFDRATVVLPAYGIISLESNLGQNNTKEFVSINGLEVGKIYSLVFTPESN